LLRESGATAFAGERVISYPAAMAKKERTAKTITISVPAPPAPGKPSASLDTRIIYCGDNLEQLAKLPDACVDLIYIDPPFNSNRNYEVFWGETREKRAFEDRHALISRSPAAPTTTATDTFRIM
jgi:16S rRNA G966 N2-methylase RsmD